MQWHPHGSYTMASKWGPDQERKRRGGIEGEGRKRKERRRDVWEAASSQCCCYKGADVFGMTDSLAHIAVCVCRAVKAQRDCDSPRPLSVSVWDGGTNKNTSLFLPISSPLFFSWMISFFFPSIIYFKFLSSVLSPAHIPLSPGGWKERGRDEGMRRRRLLCPRNLPLSAVQNPGHLLNKMLKLDTRLLSLWIRQHGCQYKSLQTCSNRKAKQ